MAYLVMPSSRAEQTLNKLSFQTLLRLHRCLTRELSGEPDVRTIALDGVNTGCFMTMLTCEWIAVYEPMENQDVADRDSLATHGFWLYLIEPLDEDDRE